MKDRHVHLEIPYFCNWKAFLLMVVGFIGGIFTSIFGVGLDICLFACMTLLFRVSEKTATPTTGTEKGGLFLQSEFTLPLLPVMMQAIMSIIGASFKSIFMEEMLSVSLID